MADFDTTTIEEATERLIDYRGKTPPKTDSGVRLITAKVVKSGQILNEPAEYIASDFYDEWMRRGLPQKHDVLLTTEAPLGEVAILRDDERIALAQRIILLRAKPGLIDPRFLFYALQSDFGQGELKARASAQRFNGIATKVSAEGETFGPGGTLGRETPGEVVLLARLCSALAKLNPKLPPEAGFVLKMAGSR